MIIFQGPTDTQISNRGLFEFEKLLVIIMLWRIWYLHLNWIITKFTVKLWIFQFLWFHQFWNYKICEKIWQYFNWKRSISKLRYTILTRHSIYRFHFVHFPYLPIFTITIFLVPIIFFLVSSYLLPVGALPPFIIIVARFHRCAATNLAIN